MKEKKEDKNFVKLDKSSNKNSSYNKLLAVVPVLMLIVAVLTFLYNIYYQERSLEKTGIPVSVDKSNNSSNSDLSKDKTIIIGDIIGDNSFIDRSTIVTNPEQSSAKEKEGQSKVNRQKRNKRPTVSVNLEKPKILLEEKTLVDSNSKSLITDNKIRQDTPMAVEFNVNSLESIYKKIDYLLINGQYSELNNIYSYIDKIIEFTEISKFI